MRLIIVFWECPRKIGKFSISQSNNIGKSRGVQSGAKTYYYRAEFQGFFCCPTFWIFWEGNLKFQKLKSYFRLHLGPNSWLSMVFGMGGSQNLVPKTFLR